MTDDQLMQHAIDQSKRAALEAEVVERLKRDRLALEEIDMLRAIQESQEEDDRRQRETSQAREEEAVFLQAAAESSRAAEEERRRLQREEEAQLLRALEQSQQEMNRWQTYNPTNVPSAVASSSQVHVEDSQQPIMSPTIPIFIPPPAYEPPDEMTQRFHHVIPLAPSSSIRLAQPEAQTVLYAHEETPDSLLEPPHEIRRLVSHPTLPSVRRSLPDTATRPVSAYVTNSAPPPHQQPGLSPLQRVFKPLPIPPPKMSYPDSNKGSRRLPALPSDRNRRASAPSSSIYRTTSAKSSPSQLPSPFEEEEDPFDDSFAAVSLHEDNNSLMSRSSSMQSSSLQSVHEEGNDTLRNPPVQRHRSLPSSPPSRPSSLPIPSSLPSMAIPDQNAPMSIYNSSLHPSAAESSLSLADSMFSQSSPGESDIDLTKRSDQLEEDFKGVRIGFPIISPHLQ